MYLPRVCRVISSCHIKPYLFRTFNFLIKSFNFVIKISAVCRTNCRVKLDRSFCKGRHEKLVGSTTRSSKSVETVLATNVHSQVLLQTLLIQLRGQNKQRSVRAIIDTGS